MGRIEAGINDQHYEHNSGIYMLANWREHLYFIQEPNLDSPSFPSIINNNSTWKEIRENDQVELDYFLYLVEKYKLRQRVNK